MPSVLITGANRGIGLDLARHYAAAGWQVHATARDLIKATELASIEGDIHLYEVDVLNRDGIKTLAAEIDHSLDVVIANAGTNGLPAGTHTSGLLGELDFSQWEYVMQVNLYGAVATCEAFAEHVKQTKGKMVAISSQLGSNTNATFGGYAYNSSKAALNMAMNLMAQELLPTGVAVGALHPGWVKTDMGGENAPVSPAQSAEGLKQVIESLEPHERATFKDYAGQTLPW